MLNNALHLTLKDIFFLIRLLLNQSFSHALPGSSQKYKLKEIYRQFTVGCYHISIEKIMNRLDIDGIVGQHRRKLYT